MAVRSIEYNNLRERLQMIHGDIKEMPKQLGYGKYDVVTCNPPYFLTPSKEEINPNEHLAIARHEILCTLEDAVKASSQLVRQGGKVAFVHRPGRLMDIITVMRQYRLEPKRIQFVYPKQGKEANTLLIEAIKDGSPDLKILPPLFVYNELGNIQQKSERFYMEKNKGLFKCGSKRALKMRRKKEYCILSQHQLATLRT